MLTHPLLLKSREAAQVLSISERTLWELTDRGEIPVVRIGRNVRYAVADLQTWIEGKRVEKPRPVLSNSS